MPITSSLENPKILCIRDTGIGIAAEDLPRIFEKGFTGENGRNQKKSTGIGLYLCKKLCDQLGLEIYAQSKAGSYTKIILQFPQNNYISEVR